MGEALRAALHEIAARPMAYVAEVLQFIVLVGAIGLIARRPLTKRLAARRERITAELIEAEGDEHQCIALSDEALAVVSRAEEEARGIVVAARAEAEKEREAGTARAQAEAEQALLVAREAVEHEKARVIAESSARLVTLTTEIARRYLDEFLTEDERRSMTEKVVLETLEEMGRGPLPRSRE